MIPPLFSDAALQAQAERALAAIPEGKRGALLVGVRRTNDQTVMAETRLAVKIGGDWTLAGAADAALSGPWAGAFTGSLSVRGTW